MGIKIIPHTDVAVCSIGAWPAHFYVKSRGWLYSLFDAASLPEVAALKAPGSILMGQANVFVFPSLEAGNIGYKLVERLAGFTAVGPFLQGFEGGWHDLSRGCSAQDIYKVAVIGLCLRRGQRPQ